MTKKKEILWKHLIQSSLVDSEIKAKALIAAGQVLVNDQRIDKPHVEVDLSSEIRIKKQKKFVSRAGDKLHYFINEYSLSKKFEAAMVLDAGASTGGFTNVALDLGAKKVVAVDVGKAQLDWSIRNHDKVEVFEKTDIQSFVSDHTFDIFLMDISFQSIARISKNLPWNLLKPKALCIFLVKPQFELSSSSIPSGGVVKDQTLRMQALDQVKVSLPHGLGAKAFHADSALEGRMGNRELFLCFDYDKNE